MKNFNWGRIYNHEGTEYKDIEVSNFTMPVSWKGLLVGGSLITAGIGCLLRSAFNKGALAYEQAEYDTMDDLGLFGDGEPAEHLRKPSNEES